jgi:glycerol-3-phosphate acyltransferase PlsX
MRVGIDAMGGDQAPVVEVRGALNARDLLGRDDRIVLVGRESAIREQLRSAPGWQEFIEIHHAEQVIGMDDPPVETLRARSDSSIAVMAELHKAGQIDACISAGNTGAFVAAATMRLRRLPGVHRPGIAVAVPTMHGTVVMCDVGANVDCRPQHLHQYGVMAAVYAEAICGIRNPRVGLLSIGQEDAKGNELVKRTRQLFREDPSIRFVGNAEGSDVFRGVCDVVVCEGFVGNVSLKLIEGMASSLIRTMIDEAAHISPAYGEMARQLTRAVTTRFDFNEYGGAPLLGVNGICIICHGASADRAIRNAVRVAMDFSKHHVNPRITALLSQYQRVAHG